MTYHIGNPRDLTPEQLAEILTISERSGHGKKRFRATIAWFRDDTIAHGATAQEAVEAVLAKVDATIALCKGVK